MSSKFLHFQETTVIVSVIILFMDINGCTSSIKNFNNEAKCDISLQEYKCAVVYKISLQVHRK